jgi:hypothetical protein
MLAKNPNPECKHGVHLKYGCVECSQEQARIDRRKNRAHIITERRHEQEATLHVIYPESEDLGTV